MIAGPLNLLYRTQLDYFTGTGKGIDVKEQSKYEALAGDLGPKLADRIAMAKGAIDQERDWAQRLGEITAQLAESSAALDTKEAGITDEIVRNPATDVRTLATDLQPSKSEVECLTNARDALVHRYLPAARLRRLETNLELLKVEVVEAQVLAAISWCRTAAAMQAVLQEEGAAIVSGKRTDDLRAIAMEKMRLLDVARAELRIERNKQLEIEQARMSTGIITRSEVSSAVSAVMGRTIK